MLRQLDKFNKIIVKVLYLAIIFQQFMVIYMVLESIFTSFGKPDFYSYYLLYAIPDYIALSLFSITIVIYAALVFFQLDIIFVLFFYFDKLFRNNISKFLRVVISRISHLHIYKYISFFILTIASFFIFVTFGLNIPILIYEKLSNNTYIIFASTDAINAFFNYESAIIWGVPGYIIFFIIAIIFEKVFKKELPVDKLNKSFFVQIKKL